MPSENRKPQSLGEPDLWLQEWESQATADCGCVLSRNHDGSDNPALWLCGLHRKQTEKDPLPALAALRAAVVRYEDDPDLDAAKAQADKVLEETKVHHPVPARPGLYVCLHCGCVDVQGTAWIEMNANEIIGDCPPTDDYWCPACEAHSSRVAVLDKDGRYDGEQYKPFTLAEPKKADRKILKVSALPDLYEVLKEGETVEEPNGSQTERTFAQTLREISALLWTLPGGHQGYCDWLTEKAKDVERAVAKAEG